MDFTEARTVLWPFAKPKMPIGELFDQGIIGETEIEITEGLKEGDETVTGSYKTLRTLKDQAKVKTDKPKGKA